MDPLLTLEEVAELFRVDVATIEQLVRERAIVAYRIGNGLRFSEAALQEFLDASATNLPPRAPARGRYLAISDLLARTPGNVATFDFDRMNQALRAAGADPLPESAGRHRAWWANSETHSHAGAWLDQGWRVQSVDLDGREVTFSRMSPDFGRGEASTQPWRVGGAAASPAGQTIVHASRTPAGRTTIAFVGVGGGGCNCINRMIAERVQDVEFIAVNVDNEALERSHAAVKLRIGEKLTNGDPAIGQRAAEQSYEHLRDALQRADMIFIVAGMGGGTGTGAAPIIAQIARDLGALTFGVITKPFSIEGTRRRRIADEGAANFKEKVDTLITVPNDRLLALADKKMTISMAFALADDVLRRVVQAIVGAMAESNAMSLDRAQLRAELARTGTAHLGTAYVGIGTASGRGRAAEATRLAISSPLLPSSIRGARGVLVIVSGNDYAQTEVREVAEAVREAVGEGASVASAAAFDASLAGDLQVTLIASGLDDASDPPPPVGALLGPPQPPDGPPALRVAAQPDEEPIDLDAVSHAHLDPDEGA